MEKLEKANAEKFWQHRDLRLKLFETYGKRLVEGSADRFWGCGFSTDQLNQESKERSHQSWPGINVFGDILMHLRRRMMNTDSAFYEEAQEIRTWMRVEGEKKKRPLSSPGESTVGKTAKITGAVT